MFGQGVGSCTSTTGTPVAARHGDGVLLRLLKPSLPAYVTGSDRRSPKDSCDEEEAETETVRTFCIAPTCL